MIVLRRIAYLVGIVVVVTFLISTMFELIPGEPAYVLIGDDATPEQIEALHRQMGLDKPVHERYVRWLGDAVQGDLGDSLRGGQTVRQALQERLPVTLELLVGGQFLALLFAVPTAILGAHRPGRVVDLTSKVFSFGMISMPSFVLAVMLVLLFAVQFRWFPVSGFTPLSAGVFENLHRMALPMAVVASGPAGLYQRILRRDLATNLREDFVTMAEAKGLSPTRVLLRHALRPSLLSLVTLVGVTTAQLIGGSVITEVIFGLPGVGRLLIDSISTRDVTTVQGVVAVVGVGYVVVNGIVDVLYGAIDPRIRRGSQ